MGTLLIACLTLLLILSTGLLLGDLAFWPPTLPAQGQPPDTSFTFLWWAFSLSREKVAHHTQIVATGSQPSSRASTNLGDQPKGDATSTGEFEVR